MVYGGYGGSGPSGSKSTDSGRFGGGTTGSTGKGFGGAPESKYSGASSSSGKGSRVGSGSTTGTSGAGPGRGVSAGGPTSAAGRAAASAGPSRSTASQSKGGRVGSGAFSGGAGAGRGASIGGPSLGKGTPSTASQSKGDRVGSGAYGGGAGAGRGVTAGGPSLGTPTGKGSRVASPIGPGRGTTIGGRSMAEVAAESAAIDRRMASTMPSTPRTRGLTTATEAPSMMPTVAARGPVTPAGVTMPTMQPKQEYRVDLTTAPKVNVEYVNPYAGKQPSDIADRLAAAVAQKYNTTEDARVVVTSGRRPTPKGQRDPRTGKISSGRHVEKALDYQVQVKTEQGWQTLDRRNPEDQKALQDITDIGMSKFGVLSTGYGKKVGQYMGPLTTHADIDPRANEWSAAKADAARHAAARQAYRSSTVAPPTPVASLMSTQAQTTPQMAALNMSSRTPAAPTSIASRAGPTTVAGRTTPSPATTATTAYAPATTRGTPTPTPRSSVVDSTTTRSVTTPQGQAVKPQGFGSYVRAGVIDALVGSNPVGMAAQVAALLGTGKTVGGAIDAAVRGEYGPNMYKGQTENYIGKSGGRADYGERSTVPAANRQTKTAEAGDTSYDVPAESSFETKYLGYTDTVARPTPEQKWDWKSSRYIGVT